MPKPAVPIPFIPWAIRGLVGLSLCLAPPGASAASRIPQTTIDSTRHGALTAQAWRADLRFLARELEARHQNAFHAVSRAQFAAAVRTLDAKIPALSREQAIVGLARIVALIGDGHTRLPLDGVFHQYPIRLYRYADGIFVQAATEPYRALVGGKVVRIGTVDVNQVYAKASELVGRDNEMTVASRTPPLLTSPEVLKALGVSPTDDRVRFTVLQNGTEVTLEVRRGADGTPSPWVDARDGAQAPTPLWLKDPANNYWFEYLDASRTLYVQYNSVQNKRDETIEDFFGRVFKAAEEHPVDRMIVDLRRNGGGDGTLNWPLIYGVIRSDRLNQRGRLFVITGRRTFSAAQNCVNALEKHTRAIFVGEPTGAAPNSFGNAVEIDLPNSKIKALASSYYWQDVYPWDNRLATAPGIKAELTSEAYRTNIDPAFEAILRYQPIHQPMMAAVQAGDVTLALERYQTYRADPANANADPEVDLELVGDFLMKKHRPKEAVLAYRANAEDHPRSFTAYQNLGLAYFALGDVEHAKQALRRSLAANPTNTNIMTALQMLGGTRSAPAPKR